MNERKRLPREWDDGTNVGTEYDPELGKWMNKVVAIAAAIMIVLLLAVEWK